MRIWVGISIFLFLVGIALGILVPDWLAGTLSGDLSGLRELARMLGPFKLNTALFIFLKNVSSLLLSFALSPLLCIFPVISLVTNGALISFVIELAARERPLALLLAALLPHGVLELPAFIIGQAAALSFGVAVLALVFRGRRAQFQPVLRRDLKYLAIACALLLPAAFLETYISPLIAG